MATPSNAPLRQVTLDKWSAAEIKSAFADQPLLIQVRHVIGSEAPPQRRIILLIHGLNSSALTWSAIFRKRLC
jgi:hypothetical protein